MGIQQGGDGGDIPPEGDRSPESELPELPPDWGRVPDDPSELAAEAEQLRDELAAEELTGRAEPTAPAPAGPLAGGHRASVGTPLLIMTVAVVITLVSLFAMAWSGSGALTGEQDGAATEVTDLPPVTLADHGGRQVALRAQTPMALLLVEECDCQQLAAATAASAPAGVRVVTVGHTPPPAPAGLEPGDQQPLRLGDPGGILRGQLDLAEPPGDAATVLLVDRDGTVRHLVPAATSVAQFQGELTNL